MLPAQTQIIEAIFTDAVRELAHSAPSSDATDISITLERPKIAAHGDLASTVALQQAKAWGVSARRLAQQLADAVQAHPRACGLIESVEVAAPGRIGGCAGESAGNARLAGAAGILLQRCRRSDSESGIVCGRARARSSAG